VLDQARDAAHPLLERVKFLAITASNLDEFFMIRVSTTLKKLNAGGGRRGHRTATAPSSSSPRCRHARARCCATRPTSGTTCGAC
jgi:polyphosphate kinase